MIYITRKERFCAAHRLFRKEWTDHKNEAVFGKCSNPNWHGHNYDLYVTVKGTPDHKKGFFTDLRKLSEVIKKHIITKLDHKNINLDVDFMKGKMASTESIVIAIWDELHPRMKALNCKLHCIKLQETEHNCVEYFGGGKKLS